MIKLFILVMSLSIFTSITYSQVSIAFRNDTLTILDKNIERGCTTHKFGVTSQQIHDTLIIVERDTIPLTTCGVCYYNLSTSFIGLISNTYHIIVVHRFAQSPQTERTDTVARITYTIPSQPSVPFTMTYSQSGCNSSPQYVDETNTVPRNYSLLTNYPNPFNPGTMIRFVVSKKQHVSLSVFNLEGQLIALLVNETKSAGVYERYFTAPDLASGLYVCRFECGGEIFSTKLVVLK